MKFYFSFGHNLEFLFKTLQIPADMVINAMIVTMMMAHANQSCDDAIYHVGSSLRNPMNSLNVHNFSHHYFTKNPLIDRNGKPTKTRKLLILSTMSRFRLYMKIRYSLPLKVCHHKIIKRAVLVCDN